MKITRCISILFSCLSLLGVFSIVHADAGASLLLLPSAGTFVVGSTFDVSLQLDTDATEANAIAAYLSFPPEKLQVVSSSAGKSVIDLWSVPPRFNNQQGTIELQGVVTGGLHATDALITTVTFRTKNVGSAVIKITDASRVLRHDGNGTDYLQNRGNGVYIFVLPPPAGPLVESETHPNQERWYKEPNVSLSWDVSEQEPVEGYSYIVDKTPVSIPDTISEGTDQSVVYQQVSDGTSYFHIKAIREGMWGGTTHFAVNIDTMPPAEFPVEIAPGVRTSAKQLLVQFITTDALSGMDHYEVKIVPLMPGADFVSHADEPLFIEAQSPFVAPVLEQGKYDIIVRAYDKADNVRESVQRVTIRDVFFGLISESGIEVDGWFVIPWFWVVVALIIILLCFGYEARRLYRKERSFEQKDLPPDVRDQLKKLRKYQDKYGKIITVLLLYLMVSYGLGENVFAERELKVEPPLIITVSSDISNEDIFYAGGKTNIPRSNVILYLQNLTTGETRNFEVSSDQYGEWFYTHNTFLSSGDYLLWAQSKVGESMSAPSPQSRFSVRPTAIQFGSSRFSLNFLYQLAILVLVVMVIALSNMILQGRKRLRKRQEQALREVWEAEEAVRRGFVILRKDIQAELAIIENVKMEKELRKEEQEREIQLMNDLADIERRIGKEIQDIEVMERGSRTI